MVVQCSPYPAPLRFTNSRTFIIRELIAIILFTNLFWSEYPLREQLNWLQGSVGVCRRDKCMVKLHPCCMFCKLLMADQSHQSVQVVRVEGQQQLAVNYRQTPSGMCRVFTSYADSLLPSFTLPCPWLLSPLLKVASFIIELIMSIDIICPTLRFLSLYLWT